ncbi:hypothetical protein C8Q76DRAFT_793116 [Earliella scabrosa]|nr:hypothetical protein C8Q76DRAFT_793116 [Earliella scabrosa]
MSTNVAFPAEIFLAIKSFIPVSDLRTHVCYYQASPRIAALYDSDSDPDSFWHQACWYCGIGCSQQLDGDPAAPGFWRDLAIRLIERDGFCEHPHCGEALLAYNRKRVEQALKTTKPLSVKQYWTGEDMSPEIVGSMHHVLRLLEFSDEDGPPTSLSVLAQARIRAEGIDDIDAEDQGQTAMFVDHPLLSRSFATEIVTNEIELGLGDGMIRSRVLVCNRYGVTVLDVIAAVHDVLDDGPLLFDDLWDFVKNHKAHFPDWLWMRTVFEHFNTLRAVHRVW